MQPAPQGRSFRVVGDLTGVCAVLITGLLRAHGPACEDSRDSHVQLLLTEGAPCSFSLYESVPRAFTLWEIRHSPRKCDNEVGVARMA